MSPIGDQTETTQMLTEMQKAKLKSLTSSRTRYEVEMVASSGFRYLIAYTARRSFRGLLDVVRQRGAVILRVLGLPEDTRVERDGAGALRFPDGTIVRFSGRTQRDAIVFGELPFVCRAPE
jgi:hypothetical protein